MAVTTLIKLYRGEAITVPFAFQTATDITGWTITFTVSDRPNSTTKVVSSVTCTHVDDESGEFSVVLSADDTDLSPSNLYFWDVWRTDSGYERMLGSGRFMVVASARVPTT